MTTQGTLIVDIQVALVYHHLHQRKCPDWINQFTSIWTWSFRDSQQYPYLLLNLDRSITVVISSITFYKCRKHRPSSQFSHSKSNLTLLSHLSQQLTKYSIEVRVLLTPIAIWVISRLADSHRTTIHSDKQMFTTSINLVSNNKGRLKVTLIGSVDNKIQD